MNTKLHICFAASILIFSACQKKDISKPSISAESVERSSITDSLYIGAYYGGGIVFWLDSAKQHGLIFALGDLGDRIYWSDSLYILTGATLKGLGTGYNNTKRIIRAQGKTGNYAALLCANYRGGGYSDWYLPAYNELLELYKQRALMGVYGNAYWSSTEETDVFVKVFLFGPGIKGHGDKALSPISARPIRRF